MVLENINQDLIAYYSLEETSGTRLDFARSNDLTDNNTVTSNTGKIGTAASFISANSEYLSIPSNVDLDFGDEDFTTAGWFYLSTKTLSQGLVAKWTALGNQRGYMLQYAMSAVDRIRFLVSGDGSATTIVPANSFGAPSTGVFIFVVCWHDSVANTINIQINNGTVDSVAHTTGAFLNTSIFTVGAQGGDAGGSPTAFLDGRADEVPVWNRILTSTEKAELYNGGAGVNLQLFITSSDILASVGGYVQGLEVGSVSGFIGGYADSRGFLGPDGNIGGFVFSKADDNKNIFAIFGGFLDVPGIDVGPTTMGGFALSLPITQEDPVSIGGVASGLFQVQQSIGGYSFGQPAFTNFVATRGRTLIIATSEDVAGQDLNIDAQIIFKALSTGDFNAKLDNIKTSQGDVIAAVQVEKFQLPPTVSIQSVELMPESGETGPLNTLSPSGARQVCVTASGFLNDGDEFVSAHIDFADPFTNQPGTANKPFLSVSGFTGPPPWTACHDFDMSGIYKITARAQDNRGMVSTAMSGIALTSGLTAGIHYPVVSISGTPRFGEVPPSMQVNFTLESSGLSSPQFTSKEINNSLVQSPTDDRILWQLSNREKSSKKNPFTFYQSPGVFSPKVMMKFNHPSGYGQIMVSDSLLIGFVR